MMVDIGRLTELADKVLKQQSIEQKYRGVCNLQDKIKQDIGDIISCCGVLIGNNQHLRFGDYLNNIYNSFGMNSMANKCLWLCTEYFNDIVEYENDTTEKKAERLLKLKEFAGTLLIQLPPKKVIQHMGAKCYTEVIRDVSPDLIYCQHGTYRQYSEVCKGFEYQACREIQKNGISNQDLKPVFQAVCLFVALKNEQKIIEEELLLLGVNIEPDKERPLLKQKQVASKPQQITIRENVYFAKAIEAGLMEKTDSGGYRWLHNNGMKASLGYFLDRVFNPKGTAQIPCKRLAILFGVTRLDTAIDQAINAKKHQKWRKEIDTLFDD